ncbi:phytoene/squalene synthase family protein [Sapientia aquatica]|uniref:Phytoene/squalene synthase family protein n=1 Tax=Sapientia aquatica TaxID=1549640 RepID=A0A4R5VQ03_9BURK|nr:squalene/phytoene synthase family protein [Sapientia aquatica]TDK59645.1 phytoene/squalene synthase family protein [Sapientia aquatica]
MANITIPASSDYPLIRKGKNVRWAKRLLGQKHALRVTRLYYFFRYIRSIANQKKSVVLARRQIMKIRVAILSNHTNDSIIASGLELIRECSIKRNTALELVAGVSANTDLVRITDMNSLLRYCYRVAGTVGLMLFGVLDTDQHAASPYAIDLGIAIQLTKICRDIKSDAIANRRYLPGTLVKNMPPQKLIKPADSERILVKNAVLCVLNQAEKYYQSGERGLSYLPLRARISILVSTRLYREIGRELKNRQCEYWHEQVIVSRYKKAFITLTALLSIAWNPKFWRHPAKHESHLHTPLINNDSSDLVLVPDYIKYRWINALKDSR